MNLSEVLFTSLSSVGTPMTYLGLATLVALLVTSGLPTARTFARPNASPFLAAILSMTGVVVLAALPVPMTRELVGAVLIATTLLNLRGTLPRIDIDRSIIWAVAILGAVFLIGTALPLPYMHYDYFHANMNSMELARTGSVLSPWFAGFDPTGWYLLDQSTSIVLDALEILWTGTDTGFLSRLYTLALCAYLLTLLGRDRSLVVTAMICAALCLYLIDNALTFRPHIYVGLLTALIAHTVMTRPRNFFLLSALLLVALALAKRDGLVLAPVLAGLVALRARPDWVQFRHPVVIAGAIAMVLLLAIGLTITQIGGKPVGLQLLNSVQSVDMVSLFQRAPIWWLNGCLALTCTIYLHSKPRLRGELVWGVLVAVLVSALILASGILLEGADRFNDGTMLRKVIYFLFPVLLTLGVHTIPHRGARRPHTFVGTLVPIGAVAVLLIAIAFNLQSILSPRASWGLPAIESVAFYRDAVPDEDLSIGVLSPGPDDFSYTPFGDVQTYQFGLLTAFLGRELRFADNVEALSDQDVILLPRLMLPDDRRSLIEQTHRSYRELDGGIGMLVAVGLDKIDGSPWVMRLSDGKPASSPLIRTPWAEVEKSWSADFRVAEIPWPDNRTQVMIAWPYEQSQWRQPFILHFPNQSRRDILRVEFSPHPLGDREPLGIGIRTSERDIRGPSSRYSRNGRYVVEVNTDGAFDLLLFPTTETINPVWGAPYVALFDLKVTQAD